MDEEDRLLVQGLKAGDEHSFREIYDKYHKQLYSCSLKYLRRKELAEDAVHDIFIKLWNNRKRIEESGSLRGFLFTAAKNHIFNILNRQKRKLKKNIEFVYEKRVAQKEPDNIIVLSEYRDVYQSVVSRLPEKRREIFKLRKEEGLTNGEIAEYLELSIHTVKSQYYKAAKFIKKYTRENIKEKEVNNSSGDYKSLGG